MTAGYPTNGHIQVAWVAGIDGYDIGESAHAVGPCRSSCCDGGPALGDRVARRAGAHRSARPAVVSGAVAVADNAGVSADAAPAEADFDGFASGYSTQALFNTGIIAGSPITAGGVRYLWPNVHSGQPDNVVAAGQRLVVSGPPGATTLGVLGSAEGNAEGWRGRRPSATPTAPLR